MLKYLQAEAIWDEETNDLYKRESEPILGSESPHVDYEILLADFQRAEDRLIPVLEGVSEAELGLVWEEDERKRMVGALLSSLVWHETIHVGQFEYLRQMTGVDDKVF